MNKKELETIRAALHSLSMGQYTEASLILKECLEDMRIIKTAWILKNYCLNQKACEACLFSYGQECILGPLPENWEVDIENE